VRARLARALPQVRGDAIQLQQVVLNLLLNAQQAMSVGASEDVGISITTTHRSSDDVVLSVSDAGPGFPPQDLERVFEAFYTTRPDGSGMGLAISRSIIEAHSGRIWAENRRNGGARVCVLLPAAMEEGP
jgi:signal transduction histidine kinase